MKIKMFTHTDLDGVGCSILLRLAYMKHKDKVEIDVEYCGYGDIDNKVRRYIIDGEYNNYNRTYITDISVNKENASLINALEEQDLYLEDSKIRDGFVLLDHHESAMWLNKYDWCKVKTKRDDKPGNHCGTDLLFEELLSRGLLDNYGLSVMDFVELVRKYDTWEWKTVYKDETPDKLNSLLYIYTRDVFVTRIIDNLLWNNWDFEFTKEDISHLQIDSIKRKNYFKMKEKNIRILPIEGYTAGVVFAEQYVSELGNYLSEQHPEFDFIIIIGDKTISYRTVKDGINLSDLAKKYGGGGHIKASGSQIDNIKIEKYICDLFGMTHVKDCGNYSCVEWAGYGNCSRMEDNEEIKVCYLDKTGDVF